MNYSAKTHSFFEDVFAVCELIPEGRVCSYVAIARYLGAPRSARMVGWAMNASFGRTPEIPAHRVVNAQGLLTGKMHFSQPNEMEEKLKAEGIPVIKDQIVDFEKYFWDPSIELSMDS